MKLDLNALDVQSFSVESAESTAITTPPGTGPEGPYSLCWICRPTDPGVPTCGCPPPTPPVYPLSYVVDSRCLCYA